MACDSGRGKRAAPGVGGRRCVIRRPQQPGLCAQARNHSKWELYRSVKRGKRVSNERVGGNTVKPALALNGPSPVQWRSRHPAHANRRPSGHAAISAPGAATAWPCSKRSASTRNARDSPAAIACCGELPPAITPGGTRTLPPQRPSASRPSLILSNMAPCPRTRQRRGLPSAWPQYAAGQSGPGPCRYPAPRRRGGLRRG